MSDIVIRPLRARDVVGFRELRFDALRQYPACFATSVSEWTALSIGEVADMLSGPDDNLVLGAFADERSADGELIGIVGLLRHAKEKYQHKASVWGLYVQSTWQGRGVAQVLLERLIEHARDQSGLRQMHLTVTGDNPARALYEKFGFLAYGLEPRGLHVGDEDYRDEVLMVLDLRV